MKKALLSVFGICASMAAVNAQQGFNKTAGYAMDYFTQEESLQDVYWWSLPNGDTTLITKVPDDPISGTCKDSTVNFTYTAKRAHLPTGGSLKFTLSQPYGKYQPVGVSFDNKTLDISKGNAFLGFRLVNTSKEPIVVKVALQDIDTNLINSMVKPTSAGVLKPETSSGDYWKEEINFTLQPNQAVDTVLDWNKTRFEQASVSIPYYAEYHLDACERNKGELDPPVRNYEFDYTRLAAVTFTVVSATQIPSDGHKPTNLNNATFEISKFRVGTQIGLGVEDEAALAAGKFGVYPNPATSGKVTLTASAQNVKVVDVLGNVVYSATSAQEIDVTNFTKGVYMVQSSKGATRFVVE